MPLPVRIQGKGDRISPEVDLQDRLHIVLRDARSARYKVTDFVYDSGSGEFTGTVLLDGDGINYMGTAGK